MLHRLTLSYRGERYAGWQRQQNAVGVQQVVEEALSDLVREPVSVVGAGRTDAGVHALGQVVHLSLEKAWPSSTLLNGTNHFLPPDVRVMSAVRAAPDFHARRCSVAKEYRYRASLSAVVSALDAPFVVPIPARVDPKKMREAAHLLEGEHDFTAFAKTGGAHTRPVRTIFRAEILQQHEELVFRFVGSGFLRGMVRALVGSLVEVGLGKRSLDNFSELLGGRPRSEAGPNAKAHGLVLMRVFYEFGEDW